MDKILPVLEGLVFLAGDEGLSLLQLQSALQETSRQDLQSALKDLQKEYEKDSHGISLVEYGGKWRFVTKEMLFPYGRALFGASASPELSMAAMETLAVIAYKQPVTRVEIEEIRGVGADAILRKLQAWGLIQAKDRLDAVGRPLLYTVTDAFLDAFALESLDQLPPLDVDGQQDLFEENQEEN